MIYPTLEELLLRIEPISYEEIIIPDDVSWKRDWYAVVRTGDEENPVNFFFVSEAEMEDSIIYDQEERAYIIDKNVKYYISATDEPAIETIDNLEALYNNGKLHRDDGPALKTTDGLGWFHHGLRHRTDGPAEIFSNGLEFYWLCDQGISKDRFDRIVSESDIKCEKRHGNYNISIYKKGTDVYHCEDMPSHINSTSKTWYKNGIMHRDDGPAFENIYGTKYWVSDGFYHRLDGPAYINGNHSEYWVDGLKVSEETVKSYMAAKIEKEDKEYLSYNKILNILAHSKSPLVRSHASRNHNTPMDILELLSKDSSAIVRTHVATNPAISLCILHELMKDKSKMVSDAAEEAFNNYKKSLTRTDTYIERLLNESAEPTKIPYLKPIDFGVTRVNVKEPFFSYTEAKHEGRQSIDDQNQTDNKVIKEESGEWIAPLLALSAAGIISIFSNKKRTVKAVNKTLKKEEYEFTRNVN